MNTKTILKYYSTTPNFRIENPNPTWKTKRGIRWNKPDCSVRSLANAMSISWIDAFDYLVAKARRDFTVPNDADGFRKWLPEEGGKWTACKAEKGKDRMTVLEFAKRHPEGRYIIQVASHYTACVDGVILDAFNCGYKCVVGYFDMNDFGIPYKDKED